MVNAYPYIPWELCKYILLFSSIILLLSGRIKRPSIGGLLLVLVLIPGLFIDQSSRVGLSEIISNLLGPISMCVFIICFYNERISSQLINSVLRLIWLTAIPVLLYSVLKTPNLENISYELGASDSAAGGFGSNQVASIMGLGIFLSYYAWMNKLLFSGNHNLDGIFIAFFAYQGLLTFSRGGIIIALLAIIVYYYYFRNSQSFLQYVKKKSLRPLLFFGFALMGIFLSYMVIENRSEGNITLRYLGETYGTISGDKIKTIDSFTTGRYSIVMSDLKLWFDNFIFGTGAGASKYIRVGKLYGISPHTEITRLLAEHGIFGFIFIIILLRISLKSMTRNKNSIYFSILIALFLIGFGTALHSAMRTFITPILISLSMLHVVDEEDYKIK